MQITDTVSLPEQLITAQRAGKLVVFAGAGVSMGPPSSLPNFEQLAERVAAGVLEQRRDEPIDVFLGRLSDQGVKVHQLVRDRLTPDSSRPTDLHRNLLRLFDRPETTRLVTTNFDTHFTTASVDVWGTRPRIYVGPALPLGSDFSGIVHLHGAVDVDPPEQMILTDRDFGRAYVTKAWVTRFLVDLFQHHTVLFVGYRHSDPVMRYLARAIVPRVSRFALAPLAEQPEQRWRELGITLVSYPLEDEGEAHAELGTAMEAWVRREARGAMAAEREIRQLISGGVPINPVDADHLADALRSAETTQFFTRYAGDAPWLDWVAERDEFRQLFQPGAEIDEVGQQLAFWFAREFACAHVDEAIGLVARLGPRMNSLLWSRLIRALSGGEDNRPDSLTMSRWISVLLQCAPLDRRPRALERLLRRCAFPEDEATILLLFEFLTRPELVLEPSLILADDESGGQPRPASVLRSEQHLLQQCWEEVLRPHIEELAPFLLPVVTRHLIHAHQLLLSHGRADENWDPTSFQRSAIEPHGQDSYPEAIDVLIDAARDVGESYAHESRLAAETVIRLWECDGPLLRRLALNTLRVSPGHDADEKIEWLLDRELLFTVGLKHEVFAILRTTYPDASETTRSSLIEMVLAGPSGEDLEGDEETIARTTAYEKFKLLSWLKSGAPADDLIEQALAEVTTDYPDFEQREHPDLYSWSSGVHTVTLQSPVSPEELLDSDPDARLDFLLTFEGGDRLDEPSREGLLDAVTAAVQESFEWSVRLVESLRAAGNWETDLWPSILRGWRGSNPSADEWAIILTLLEDQPDLDRHTRELLWLLEEIVGGEREVTLGRTEQVERLARRLFARVEDVDLTDDDAQQNLLQLAINHSGGRVAQIWVRCLAKRREATGDDWTELPEHHTTFYEEIIRGQTVNALLGIPVLASQLLFLFSSDREWTVNNLLPVLDWDSYADRAELAWHGYLTWGRWNEALLTHLLPLYRKTIAHVDALGDLRDRFAEHLAEVSVYGSSDPIDEGWLDEFAAELDLERRIAWARRISFLLRSLDDEAKTELWSAWLDAYWQGRLAGVPRPLDDAEIVEMVTEWAPRLGPVFSEVIDRVCDSPHPGPDDYTMLWHDLADSSLPSQHPDSLARLVLHVLQGLEHPFFSCEKIEELLRAATPAGASRALVLGVCEEMARLGCHGTEGLFEDIDPGDPDAADAD